MRNPTSTGRHRAGFHAILQHDRACPQIMVADLAFDPELGLGPPEAEQLRFAARDRVVRRIQARLTDALDGVGRIARVDPDLALEDATHPTLEVLHDDRYVAVLNGALIGPRTSGRPDILLRVDPADPSKGWVPALVKHGAAFDGRVRAQPWLLGSLDAPAPSQAEVVEHPGAAKRDHSVQVAHYNLLLADNDIPGPSIGAVIGNEGLLVWRHIDDSRYARVDETQSRRRASARQLYTAMLERYCIDRSAVVRDLDLGLPPKVEPRLCEHCGKCQWRDVCHRILEDNDDLTLLRGVGRLQAAFHHTREVHTRRDLAGLDVHVARKLDTGVPLTDSERHAYTTVSYVMGGATRPVTNTDGTGLAVAIDRARVACSQTPHLARGVARPDLPEPGRAAEVFLDVETTPHRRVFLAALHLVPSTGDPATRVIEDWDGVDGDDSLVARLCRQVTDWESEVGPVTVWHYTDFDRKALCDEARRRWPSNAVDLEAFIDERSRDLFDVIRRQVLLPFSDWGLKSVAAHYGFAWTDPGEIDGELAMWLYDQAANATSPSEQAAVRARIVAYNRDDVLALAHVRRCLVAGTMPQVEDLDALYPTAR